MGECDEEIEEEDADDADDDEFDFSIEDADENELCVFSLCVCKEFVSPASFFCNS